MLKNNTTIQSTDAEFHVPDIKTVGTRQIKLRDVPSLNEYDVITVTATVIAANEPQKVSQGKIKQEVIIADETGTCAVHLWEKDVNMLIQGKAYLLNKLTVRTYMDNNHLAFSSSGATAEEVDDLQDVVELPQFPVEQDEVYTAVTIDGVQQLEQNFSCINCKKNIPDSSTESMCICPNCQTAQKVISNCYTAKLFITSGDGRIALRAYDEAIKSIVTKDDNIKCEDLLFAPPFNVKFNKYHVITQITRN